MAVYEYEGIDGRGKNVRGIIDSESPRSARSKLKKEGIFASSVEEAAKEHVQAATGRGSIFSRGFSLSEQALITRQLATLLDAGLPLVDALGSLLEQIESERPRLILTQVRERVNEGTSFHEALGDHPSVFSDLYRNMVRAGESSGTLALVLEQLADLLESSLELRRKIQSAMAYPILMSAVAVIILSLLMIKVVPQLTQVFDNMGRELPPSTKALLAFSGYAQSYWPFALIACIGLGFAYISYNRTAAGRMKIDAIKLGIPRVGGLVRLTAQARFARTLGALLSAGVPLLDSLSICKPVVGNRVIEAAIDEVGEDVREGLSLHEAMRLTGQFPSEVRQMVAVGEDSGALDKMLMKVAHSFEGRLDGVVVALTSILEPLMILAMGAAVGFVVFAIMSPIVDMSGAIQ